jgi:N-acyl-D-aspartate/D-glutamate deacylase
VLYEGLVWNWQAFGEFMGALDGCAFDVAVQVSHARSGST